MKRIIVVAVALAFVLLSAGAALAGISGSAHDMRTHMATQGTGQYLEVCVYCHTPHNAIQASAPLWSRTNPANGAYQYYTSTTMNATISGTIGTGSLICMSCHDGTMAVDQTWVALTGSRGTSNNVALDSNFKMQASRTLLGTDLRNNHPIGFTYASAITNGDTTLNTLASVTANAAVRLSGTALTVECSSCHDAHNTANAPFLRSSNAGSAMCLVCHNK